MLTVLWAGNWYLTYTTDSRPTMVTSIGGTVLVRLLEADTTIPVLQNGQLEVEDITAISTDDTSQAVLAFFDESTITLYGDTQLIIKRSHQPRYNWSTLDDLIEVELVKGRIRVVTSEPEIPRTFVVQTPHAQVKLIPGSYAVEAIPEQTQVTTRLGLAEITAGNQSVLVGEELRSAILQGQAPADPIPAEQNLVSNGDFDQPLEEAWWVDIFVPSQSTQVITAGLQQKQLDGRPAVQFLSTGQDNIHTDAAIEQKINKDVRGFQLLRITADILLNYHSLPGGGFVGSEFPILIKLSYKDEDGNDRDWYHGFYYDPPPGNYVLLDQVNNSSEQISRNLWYPYESENLLETLGDIKPVYIRSIRIYASGWIYDAAIADVKLLAQE